MNKSDTPLIVTLVNIHTSGHRTSSKCNTLVVVAGRGLEKKLEGVDFETWIICD